MADKPDYEREGAQPPPTKAFGAVSAHDMAVEDLHKFFPHNPGLDLAVAGLERRRDYGREKYGTVLHPDNGRDHLADLLDETEDKVAYFRVTFMQNPDVLPLFWGDYIAECEFLLRLRDYLASRDVQGSTSASTDR